ncbi:hypothetical protein ABEO75_28420 [Paenibacillus macerans]|uniref:hypothetical protein n=1 Tax=Paenibacillus macerans TaxID=44252 RepID=UPI002E214A83|nr:hypothetical protein [Paenibacillus macerans]
MAEAEGRTLEKRWRVQKAEGRTVEERWRAEKAQGRIGRAVEGGGSPERRRRSWRQRGPANSADH